jgi:hypothetical protein
MWAVGTLSDGREGIPGRPKSRDIRQYRSVLDSAQGEVTSVAQAGAKSSEYGAARDWALAKNQAGHRGRGEHEAIPAGEGVCGMCGTDRSRRHVRVDIARLSEFKRIPVLRTRAGFGQLLVLGEDLVCYAGYKFYGARPRWSSWSAHAIEGVHRQRWHTQHHLGNSQGILLE